MSETQGREKLVPTPSTKEERKAAWDEIRRETSLTTEEIEDRKRSIENSLLNAGITILGNWTARTAFGTGKKGEVTLSNIDDSLPPKARIDICTTGEGGVQSVGLHYSDGESVKEPVHTTIAIEVIAKDVAMGKEQFCAIIHGILDELA